MPVNSLVTPWGALPLQNEQYVLLLCLPVSFSPTGATELLSFTARMAEFHRLHTAVVATCADSAPACLGWLKAIYDATAIDVSVPLYSVVAPLPHALLLYDARGTLLCRQEYPNTVAFGANESLSLLGRVCSPFCYPADWQVGTAVLLPPPKDYATLQRRMADHEAMCCADWYLCFTDEPSSVPPP